MAKILVVDDRPINRGFLVSLLGHFGHRMIEASDGEEALQVADAERPELVITDIQMPILDGREFILRLRATPEFAHIPVIFYTATYRLPDARDLTDACDPFAVLTKPSPPELILSTVNTALGLPELELCPSPAPLQKLRAPISAHELPSGGAVVPHDVNYRMAALVEISLDLVSEREPERLLESLCHMARKCIGAEYAAIGVLNEDDQTFRHFFFAGPDGAIVQVPARSPRHGLLGELLGGRRAVRLRDVDAGRLAMIFPPGRSSVPSYLGVPFSTSRVHGWLYFTDRLGGPEFSAEDERLALTLAAQGAAQYENLQLYVRLESYVKRLDGEMADRKRAQEELARVKQEQLRLKDEMLSNVSHELRTPLAAILLFTSNLLDGVVGRLTAEQHQHVELTFSNAKQLKGMVDDLLDATRAETAKLVVEPQRTLLSESLSQAIGACQPKASEKRITISQNLPSDLPPLWGDPQRICQILVNLIGNAVKFSPDETLVAVEACVWDRDPTLILVSVRDEGPGISPENREKIFDRLFQESSGDQSNTGLGLGLFISKEMISRQGGRIWVESELGRGSTFFFTLPLFSLRRPVSPHVDSDLVVLS
jgi:signal transduction histidine kinase